VKLYHTQMTPSSRKVRIFLHEKGLEVSMEDVTEGFALAGWYRKQYPHALVPMLELDDKTQLGEALAICRYFEECQPDPPLMGVGARERAIVEMWERRAYLEGAGAVEEVFRNSHPLLVNRGLAGTDEPVPQIAALIERGKQRLDRFFQKFDRQLAANSFVAGEYFSVADITTLCAIDFGRALQMDIPENSGNVRRWYAEVSTRPSASA
jgi:glutathione S-transferase